VGRYFIFPMAEFLGDRRDVAAGNSIRWRIESVDATV
jgi:hypothetical protein